MKKPQCQSFCRWYFGWISFASNLFIALIKIGIGALTASQALVADGFHSLSDSFTAIVTIATLRVSKRPEDDSHPYGYGKVEFLSSALFAVVLLILGLFILVRSIFSMADATLVAPNILAIGPAVLSIFVNVAISNYGHCVGREINSPVIIANAKENKADALSSVASLVGIGGALLGYPRLDPLAAIVVSILIGRMGLEIMRDASSGLMDGSIEKPQRQKICRLTLAVPGVEEVAFLKTRRIGQKIWVDLGIIVPSMVSLNKGNRIAYEVRNCLIRHYPEMQEVVVYLNSEPITSRRRWLLSKMALLLRKKALG